MGTSATDPYPRFFGSVRFKRFALLVNVPLILGIGLLMWAYTGHNPTLQLRGALSLVGLLYVGGLAVGLAFVAGCDLLTFLIYSAQISQISNSKTRSREREKLGGVRVPISVLALSLATLWALSGFS